MRRMTLREFLTDHPEAKFKHRTRRFFDTREMTNFYSASLDAEVLFDEATRTLCFWSPFAEIVSQPEEVRR